MKLRDPILHSFDLLVRRDPLAPLVVSPERHATVGDVDALARAAGALLEKRPLAPGTLVGLAAANGPGFLASFLALRRAGLAVLLLDAQTPADRSRAHPRRPGRLGPAALPPRAGPGIRATGRSRG